MPPSTCVRFIDAAIGDLARLRRKDPQIVRQVLKKCLLIEQYPNVGDPLVGDLIGFRKLIVGNRTWRIVWRNGPDDDGTIEIAEVWAVGARKDAEVYAEVKRRLDSLPTDNPTRSLLQVIEKLGLSGETDAAQGEGPKPTPDWLRRLLFGQLGIPHDVIDAMTADEARSVWDGRFDS